MHKAPKCTLREHNLHVITHYSSHVYINLYVHKQLDLTQPPHCNNTIILSFELQGIDTGMVSYDGTVYASLETGVARYRNN